MAIRKFYSARLLAFAPLLAAAFFGGWAAYTNSEYGAFVMGRAGFAQAMFALLSTLAIGKVADMALRFFAGWPKQTVISAVLCIAFLVSIPLAIHYAIGTPEIVKAILPGVTWGSAYVVMLIRIRAPATTSTLSIHQ